MAIMRRVRDARWGSAPTRETSISPRPPRAEPPPRPPAAERLSADLGALQRDEGGRDPVAPLREPVSLGHVIGPEEISHRHPLGFLPGPFASAPSCSRVEPLFVSALTAPI